ncbi:hypothetical protein CK203_038347 [Vitis vinifera]|uniref:Uncharacterized protein n=1 Tax=Vitis vinifera TaxID=29760 RepID=A0A438HEK2_VITVI|nr:hypothetical protein CK203_038347 [Vitis vinifera]
MTALLLRDCMLLVYVGRTSIPLPPTLLVSVIPFISVLTIASVRPSMCLLSDRARGGIDQFELEDGYSSEQACSARGHAI